MVIGPDSITPTVMTLQFITLLLWYKKTCVYMEESYHQLKWTRICWLAVLWKSKFLSGLAQVLDYPLSEAGWSEAWKEVQIERPSSEVTEANRGWNVAISFYPRLASSLLRKVIVIKQKHILERKSILGFYLLKKNNKKVFPLWTGIYPAFTCQVSFWDHVVSNAII